MGHKLIVVCGVTGNQGGSVARRFLRDPRFRVRGLTRDSSSEKAQELARLGVEMVQADLEDVKSLRDGFRDANLIFSVTQYWAPFFRPDCVAEAKDLNVSIRKLAYDVEYRCGRNIADAAAATANSLDDNGFLVSTLSHAARCSGGRYTDLYHYDAKADVFPGYVEKAHPELAKKMSCIHTGFFFTSYSFLPNSYFAKVSWRLQLRKASEAIRLADNNCTAERWQLQDAIPNGSRQATTTPRRHWGHGQLRLCGAPDAAGQGVHGGGHDLYMARVPGDMEEGHRCTSNVRAGPTGDHGSRQRVRGPRPRGGDHVLVRVRPWLRRGNGASQGRRPQKSKFRCQRGSVGSPCAVPRYTMLGEWS